MNLPYRIDLLVKLGEYILSNDREWLEVKDKASRENAWFIPPFVDHAANTIAHNFLRKDILEKWTSKYQLPIDHHQPHTVGIVMAGNIPLVGFHDWLCVFISGHKAMIKPSTKDETLIRHLVNKMTEWAPSMNQFTGFGDMLKNCDAYIATGSNNSAGYFDYYFKKYPHIIRRNRTSVAVLTGHETGEDLTRLADDVYLYFGLGCRNVTKIFVPHDYDFIPLLRAFDRYSFLAENHKYHNNYDYNLAIHLLNKKQYMSNDSLLLVEEPSLFSPISQLNYERYEDYNTLTQSLNANQEVQCIVGKGFIAFGDSQNPAIDQYADGVDTLQFLGAL